MLTTVLVVILVLGLGTHLSDGVRLRQEEAILRKLSIEQAHAYYELLRRRARRVRLLRAVTLASVLFGMMAVRRRFFPPPPPERAPVAETRPRPPGNTEAARELARAALAEHLRRAGLPPDSFQPGVVTGDDRHPWIFEFQPREGGDAVKIYVDRSGGTEVHRVLQRR